MGNWRRLKLVNLHGTTRWSLASVALLLAVPAAALPGESAACTLSCTASASVSSGAAPLAVVFTGMATASNCSGTVAYDWSFGDGSAHSADSSPAHPYGQAGTYAWTMTASLGEVLCPKSGQVVVGPPETPVISSPGANVVIVSAVAHSKGASGANWVSDVVLHNPGTAAASANVYFLKKGQDNTGLYGRKVPVAAGTSVLLADLVLAMFGESNTSGALLIGSDTRLQVTSRTYNSAASGTFGQFIDGYPIAQAVGSGEEVRLIMLTRTADYRTNVGFANATGSELAVQVNFFGASGTSLGARSLSVPPYGYLQDDDTFAKAGVASSDDAYAVITSPTTGAKYFTYASVIDNRTNDPVCVVPVGRSAGASAGAESVSSPAGGDAGTPAEPGRSEPTVSSCSYSLSPSLPLLAPADGGAGAVLVTAKSGCAWVAQSDVSWITIISRPQGNGDGAVAFTVAANKSTIFRSGTMTIAGQVFVVNQAGTVCNALAAPVLTAPASASSETSYAVAWTATNSAGTYSIQEATDPGFADAVETSVTGIAKTFIHQATSTTTYSYRVRAWRDCGGTRQLSSWSNAGQTAIGPAGESIWVPAAAHSDGTGGTHWRTDLEVHNPGNAQLSFAVALLVAGQDNSTPVSKTFTLGPQQSIRYSDVLFDSAVGFGITNGSATLKVTPQGGSVMVTSRTYNQMSAGNPLGLPDGSTFGQFIPGQPDSQAVAVGQEGRLLQLWQSLNDTSGYRTNIGVVNATSASLGVNGVLVNADGTTLCTPPQLTLPPYGFVQIAKVMIQAGCSTTAVADGYAVLTTPTAGGKFFAYASVIDNRSGDPVYIPVKRSP
jgi:PKD repeat protein